MKKVVSFEKRRSLYWLGRFLLILLFFVVAGVSFAIVIARELSETKTLELLTLFRENRETIAEFWQDTLNTFWEELPKGEIALAASAIVIIILIFLFARRRIGITKKRLSDIAKYQNKSKNIK